MSIECLNPFHSSTTLSDLKEKLLNVGITKKGSISELFASVLKNVHACVLFPDLEVFMFLIYTKVIYVLQSIIYFLLIQKGFKVNELYLIVQIFSYPSFWDHHILFRIPFFKLNDFPIIRTFLSVHIAKLFRHFTINSILANFLLQNLHEIIGG